MANRGGRGRVGPPTPAEAAASRCLLLMSKLLLVPLQLQLRVEHHALWVASGVRLEALQIGGQDRDQLSPGPRVGEFAIAK